MANWQDTYEKLRKRKKIIDEVSSPEEIKTIDKVNNYSLPVKAGRVNNLSSVNNVEKVSNILLGFNNVKRVTTFNSPSLLDDDSPFNTNIKTTVNTTNDDKKKEVKTEKKEVKQTKEDKKIAKFYQAKDYSTYSDEELKKEKSKLEKELVNQIKKLNKTAWWDKDDNIIENVGNVLYKSFLERDPNVHDDEYYKYKAIEKQLKDIKDITENRYVANKKLDTVDKIGYTFGGNIETGFKGVESTALKILGQEEQINPDLSVREKLASKSREESSGAGQVGLDILGSVGRMTPQILVGNPVGATAVGFANYGGGAYNEAKRDGYSEEQATKYGITVGAMEMATEKVLGAFGDVYGTTKAGKVSQSVIDKVIPKIISNKQVRNVMNQFIAEGSEEFLQEYLGNIAKDTILDEKGLLKSTYQNITDTDVLADALYSAFVGGLTGGVMSVPGQVDAYRYEKATGRSAETGLTTNEQSVVDNVVSERQTELQKKKAVDNEVNKAIKDLESTYGTLTNAEKKGIRKDIQAKLDNGEIDFSTSKLSKKEISNIEKQVKDDLRKGYISTDAIEKTLGTDADLSLDAYLQRSYNEKSLRSKQFTYQTSDSDSEFRKELAKTTDVLNDTTRSHELFETVSKISEDTGTKYGFVNNEKLKSLGHDVEGKTINGLVRVNEDGTSKVLINVDSDKALNTIIGHETTHLLEGTKEYQSLQNIVKEYAKNKGDYDSRYNQINSLYQGTNANVDNEVTSDLVGDYLFTDEDFIKNLSAKEPTVFQKVYDYIKHVYNLVTAGSKEQRELEKVKYRFEQAYNEMSKTTTQQAETNLITEAESNTIKYHISEKFSKDIDDMVRDVKRTMEQDVIDDQYIDELIHNSDNYREDEDGNSNYDEVRDALMEALEKEGIAGRYDEGKDKYIYDRQELAKKGYDELLNYLDKNNVNYEVSRSTEAGYVPSIYIKNAEGETIYRIANHDNGYVDDFDMVYNGAYNTLYSDKDYANWKERILPKIEKEIGSLEKQSTKYSLSDNQGRTLSKEQQEYFKDSKVRDEEGNLKVMYHGTEAMAGLPEDAWFTIFDTKRAGSNGSFFGTGFYFTDSKEHAQDYAHSKGKVYETYLNIKNPYIPYQNLEDSISRTFKEDLIIRLNINKEASSLTGKEITEILKENGYDGVINGDTVVAFYPEQIKNVDNTTPTNNPDIRYSLSVSEANTIKDNEDRKLTKGQKEYFKDSKVVDENGNLITVYHTMTNKGIQFNEFNPVGTDYYKFGDQVVNYYTDSKNMSGSYAQQDYEMADTSKLNNLSEAYDYVEKIKNTPNTIFSNDVMQTLNLEENNGKYALKFNGNTMVTYNSEADILKKIKVDLDNRYGKSNKYQYEGYVNITNPYEVDAEGRNWNKIRSKEDSVTTTKLTNLDTLTKDRLTQLAKDSKNLYEKTTNEYNKWNDATNSIDGSLREENPLEIKATNIVFRNVTSSGVKAFIENDYRSQMVATNDSSLLPIAEWRTNNDIMRIMVDWDLIKPSEYDTFNKTLEVPDEIRERLKKLAYSEAVYNEYDSEGRNPIKKKDTLMNIWDNMFKSAQARTNIGRYEYSQFDSKLLNGYLKNELSKSGFVVKDEFGTNETELRDLYSASSHNFDDNFIRQKFNEFDTTNDIVKEAIEFNKNGSNYDGVIIKNTVDYGGKANGDYSPANLYVTFNSNQFKAVDNTNPTTDADIRYSLAPEYGMSHRPSTDYGDASNFEENMPDVFEHPEWYMFGGSPEYKKAYKESLEALRKVRNNPNGEITIYRATIGDNFNEGDWVSPSKAYAEWHNYSNLEGKGKVIELKVKAKDIRFAGDDINEFGYFPNGVDDYSLSRFNEQRKAYGNYNIFGEDVRLQQDNQVQQQVQEAIAPLQEQVKALTDQLTSLTENVAPVSRDIVENERINSFNSLTDEEAPTNLSNEELNELNRLNSLPFDLEGAEQNRVDELTNKQNEYGTFSMDNEAPNIKNKSEIVKELKGFGMNQQEARNLYNKIANDSNTTSEDIFNELKNYRDIYEDSEYYKEIRNDIKGTRLNISNIKDQITDYGNSYRMSLMGKKLILGNSGQSIDNFYQELSSRYPDVFSPEITAEVDQLNTIADFLYKDDKMLVDRLSDEEITELADKIYNEIDTTERLKNTRETIYSASNFKDLVAKLEKGEITEEDYETALKNLPNELSEDYAPYLEFARELNASDTDKTQRKDRIRSLLDEKSIKSQETENEPTITSNNPFDELLDKFLKRQRTKLAETPKVEKSKLRNLTDTVKELTINRNVEIDNLAKESGNLNIKYAGDMLNSVAGEVGGDIYTAQTDNEGHAIGKSVSGLFQEVKKEGLYDAFNDYLEQYSNIDRHKQGKGSQTPLDVSQELVKEYESRYPRFIGLAKDVWNYGANVRANMVDSGLITQEFADTLKEMYPHYVPFMENREMTNTYQDIGEAKPKSVIKRAKGGAKNILPIEEALTKYTYAYKKAIRQNQLYQEIVKTLNDKVEIGADVRSDPTDLNESLYRDEKGNYLTAYVDGQQESVRISDDLYRGLKNDMESKVRDIEQRLSLITTPLQKASEVRRNLLTTWSPTFIITNPIKDIQDAVFNSKHTMSMLKNYPTSFIELSQAKSETAKQFLTLYGSGNVQGDYYVDSGLNKGVVQKNAKFLKRISKINDIVELAPRYAEFKASLENGATIQEAMYNAREITTNFNRGGVITKALNRNGATFLNVSVQGFDKFVRNFSGENGAKGVVGSLLKASLFGVLPAVFNEMAFGGDDDDDKDEDYEALPNYIKDNYYLIKTENGDFIRIPKGRMLSVFGSTARRTLEYMQGNEDAFEGYLENVWAQVGFNNPEESNLLTPIKQAINNEAWYGGDLVPSRLQKLAPKEQYDASTDNFSIWLGDKLNISPYKINYVLDQYTGGIGDMLLPLITEEAQTDSDSIPDMMLAPIRDKFVVNSTSDNKYASDLYTLTDKMDKVTSDIKATDEYKIQDSYLYSITSEMAELYQERRDVQANKNLSKSEKYKKVQSIQEQINSLAKEGLDNYNNVEKTDNYAIVGGREFNKYTTDDGEERWGRPKEDELNDLNSMGMTLQEKSSYYRAKTDISSIKDEYKGSKDYTGQKREIITTIKDSGLNDEQKSYLYDKYYASSETLDVVKAIGIDFDSYLDYEYQNFTADKDSDGKTISGSKKQKVFDYINSMDIGFEEKVILAKLQYNTYDEYNYDIIDYLNNNDDISYDQEVAILKKLGFKVDDEGNIYW